MNECTAQCAPSEPVRPAKHSVLFSLYHQVSDVVQRVDSLNSQLGVYNNKPTEAKEDQPKGMPDPGTLVEVIDRLPSMIGGKLSELHNLLNELEDSLN